jgi:integrase/recombinase XerD
MRHAAANPLPHLLESFFCEHLQRARGASPRTVHAYRDTLRLLLIYLAETAGGAVADLQPDALQVEAIAGFLTHLESVRGNSATTRNCRLAAIHCFCKHLIREDPMHAEQYHRILSLPAKRTRSTPATYLEPEDVHLILDQVNDQTPSGQRDHALLLFLYNTGARVSEALAVQVQDLDLNKPAQVRLHGKGGKDRICPLWAETASALRCLTTRCQADTDGTLFRSRRGAPLSRDGAAYILQRYVRLAAVERPPLQQRRVTPHVLRHSCAVALLQAGVDITVIRDYLGHASVATTSHYVTANLRMKREVLEAFWNRAGIAPALGTAWGPKPDLLAFLDSL